MRGHDSVVSALIERKAFVHQRTDKGDSALSLACWKNHTACAMMLLTAGADALQVDQFGDTMLLDASKHGNQAVMSLLIAKGLSLNHRNKEGKCAMIRAAEFGQPNGVSLLLEHKADMNIQDNKQQTALHHSCVFASRGGSSAESSLRVVRMLVEAGANTQLRDHRGQIPAQCTSNAEILSVLGVTGGASAPRPGAATTVPGSKTIQELAKAGKTNEVKMLLDSGVDVNSKDSYGETALHETARYGHDNTAALLLQRRADVNIQAERNNGWQPLHIAGHYGKIGVAMQLIDAGAGINKKDGRGDTALTLAVRNKQQNIVRSVLM
jgi:serine/threonine-protein phosphatase 6 regulatory ankyrin repeat subunit A